ncbi:MAG: hypothetical protein HY077_17135 [Elusimicrobia bacterium]|nr:hypothetical protein [Elusimicrobiota bacterium]
MAILLMGLAAFGADKSQPKLTLTLRLAKTRWRVGEYLWYRLEIRNDGPGIFKTTDKFWTNHWRLERNELTGWGTFFELLDSGSHPLAWRRERIPGERCWVDDMAGWKSSPGFAGLQLSPSDTSVATPTKLHCDSKGAGKPPQANYMATGMRPLPFVMGPYGFRILPWRWIAAPGHYRIRARLDERPELLGSDGDFAMWAHISGLPPSEIEYEYQRLQEGREIRNNASSNFVEFEVVP